MIPQINMYAENMCDEIKCFYVYHGLWKVVKCKSNNKFVRYKIYSLVTVWSCRLTRAASRSVCSTILSA
jgi:hypothetical protein